jgi:hypothetical protein
MKMSAQYKFTTCWDLVVYPVDIKGDEHSFQCLWLLKACHTTVQLYSSKSLTLHGFQELHRQQNYGYRKLNILQPGLKHSGFPLILLKRDVLLVRLKKYLVISRSDMHNNNQNTEQNVEPPLTISVRPTTNVKFALACDVEGGGWRGVYRCLCRFGGAVCGKGLTANAQA